MKNKQQTPNPNSNEGGATKQQKNNIKNTVVVPFSIFGRSEQSHPRPDLEGVCVDDYNVPEYPIEIEAVTTPGAYEKSVKNDKLMNEYRLEVVKWREDCHDCERRGKEIPPKPKKPEPIEGSYPLKVFWRKDDHGFDGYSTTVRSLVKDPKAMEFVDSISCRQFEYDQKYSIRKAEILKNACDPMFADVRRRIWAERTEMRKLEDAKRPARPYDKIPTVHEVMRSMKLEHWIVLITMMFKGIPKLVEIIDNDVKRIAFCSSELASKGYTTIQQVDMLVNYEERKSEYINAYVLNQMFASLMKTEMERDVFVCMLQKLEDVKKIKSQKLRTAYRHRRLVMKKCVEYCKANGFNEVWFYGHFAKLPAVQYYVETQPVAKRVKELM